MRWSVCGCGHAFRSKRKVNTPFIMKPRRRFSISVLFMVLNSQYTCSLGMGSMSEIWTNQDALLQPNSVLITFTRGVVTWKMSSHVLLASVHPMSFVLAYCIIQDTITTCIYLLFIMIFQCLVKHVPTPGTLNI